MKAFLTAVSFLTRIPIPGNAGNDYLYNFSKSTIFFPVVGAIIGAIDAGMYIILKPFLPQSVLAVLLIALPVFLTGGIHFDGLMDTCDGIFSGRPRQRILEIMKDSRVGSMGVIVGIFNVILRYSILLELPGTVLPVMLITQAAAGRWVMAMGVHFFPYARKEGGLGESFMAGKKLTYLALGSVLTLLIILLLTGPVGIVIAFGAGGVSMVIAIRVACKIGGLTGDVYGAMNEVTENVFLLLWLVGYISMNLLPAAICVSAL